MAGCGLRGVYQSEVARLGVCGMESPDLDTEKQILLVGRLLHERLNALADEAEGKGLPTLANDIRDVKLQLANAITLIVLTAQSKRLREKVLG